MLKVSNRQPQCLVNTAVYPLFLMQESRDVFVVFIDIIFSHGDMSMIAILHVKYFGNFNFY